MVMRKLLAVWLLGQSAGMTVLPAQDKNQLDEVHRVYLKFPANRPSLTKVALDLGRALERSGVKVVATAADADAVLAATGDVYLKGYVSLNPRSGAAARRGERVMGGYLSVELKGKANGTLWSYLATPKFGSTRIEEDLSKQVTKELLAAIHGKRSGQP